jgi:hypothetical protein
MSSRKLALGIDAGGSILHVVSAGRLEARWSEAEAGAEAEANRKGMAFTNGGGWNHSGTFLDN